MQPVRTNHRHAYEALHSRLNTPWRPSVRSTALTHAASRSPSRMDASRRSTAHARNPVTDGYICAKVRRFPERVYGPDRLTCIPRFARDRRARQLRARVVGRSALDSSRNGCSRREEQWGGEVDPAVLLRRLERPADAGHERRHAVQTARARRGWRERSARRRPAPPTWRCTARCRRSPTRTFPEARLIILWGANPSTSGIHLVPYIREAQRRGATLDRHRPAHDTAGQAG